MEKVYVFLADGFEEIEGLTVVDILRRADICVETVSVMGRREITGSHQIVLMADRIFEETDFEDAVMLVLPGGMPGTKYLAAHEGLAELLKHAQKKEIKTAAICAAPSVLGGLGLLREKRAVCYPGFEEQLEGAFVGKEPVAVDGTVTTSRGMGTAILFALSLVTQLKDEETAEKLAKGILYQ